MKPTTTGAARPGVTGTSRRHFIRQTVFATAALSAGAILPACRPGNTATEKPAAGGRGTLVTRRNIATMAPDDPTLLMFREAVRVMKKRSEVNQLDPTGWLMNGTWHSLYCATSDYKTQVHYSWLFLPWHRAYLSFLEKQMQAAINEPTFALPYWDWSTSPRMPAHYFGDDNPLYDVTRESWQTDEIPADFMNIGAALRAPTFSSVGGFEKGDPGIPQVEGIVEQSFHNNIHNWIGGNMAGFPTATLDPLFSGHHGNIDRFWAAWLAYDPGHRNPDSPLWRETDFGFYDGYGRLTRIAVKDTLRTEDLGYRFDTLHFGDPAAATAVPEPGSPIARVALEVPEANRSRLGEALSAGRRVILRFDRVQLPTMPLTIRVFLNNTEATLRTPLAGSGFVGTFTMLPVGSPVRGLEKVVTMQMEVSPQVGELIRNGRPITVSLVPIPLRGRTLPTETVQVRGATLVLDE